MRRRQTPLAFFIVFIIFPANNGLYEPFINSVQEYKMMKKLSLWLLAVIVAFGLVLAGCQMDGDDSGSNTSYDGYDVLVVGSGISGSLAALGAKEAGAEKVLLIEKMIYYGGTSRLADGGFSQYNAKTQAQEFLTEWRWHSIVGRTAANYGAIPNYPFNGVDTVTAASTPTNQYYDMNYDVANTAGANKPDRHKGAKVILTLEEDAAVIAQLKEMRKEILINMCPSVVYFEFGIPE
jgi:hypothetical protein